jgi:hypothetical protein
LHGCNAALRCCWAVSKGEFSCKLAELRQASDAEVLLHKSESTI